MLERLKCNASSFNNPFFRPVCLLFCAFIVADLYSTGEEYYILLLPDKSPAQVWDDSVLPGRADQAFILTDTISKYGSKRAIRRYRESLSVGVHMLAGRCSSERVEMLRVRVGK